MGFLDDCETYYGSRDLYLILRIEKNSDEKNVKKAYRKMSLLVHPDRVGEGEKEAATRKFQVLGKIFVILSDKDKKAIYDETGEVDDDDESFDKDWVDYWRLLFPKITKKDIDKCLADYKGSNDEKEDLKKWYLKYKGDMNSISECLIGYDFAEEERYAELINKMIDEEEIPAFKIFTEESASRKKARQKRYEKEAEEAEKEGAEAADEDMSSLIGAIQKRTGQRFNDMISHLENKYTKTSSSKTKSGRKKSAKK